MLGNGAAGKVEPDGWSQGPIRALFGASCSIACCIMITVGRGRLAARTADVVQIRDLANVEANVPG